MSIQKTNCRASRIAPNLHRPPLMSLSVAAAICALLVAVVPALAQTTVSRSTPAPNSVTAPTTVPPQASPTPLPPPQSVSTLGTLQGSLVSNDGIPTNTNNYTGGVTITGVRRDTGETFQAKTDPAYGGFYKVANLIPGVYDITVPASYLGSTPYSAEQVNDVTVGSGQQTTLNITVYPGTRQLATGAPASISLPVAQQLARDAQTIHELEVQMDALREQIEQLQTQVSGLQSRTAGH